jgi:hypothetical protein
MYVGNLLYILYYPLHSHMWPILQSGGLHYVLIYISYNEIIFLMYLCKQHLYLSCERLCMARLHDCSILQPGNLVKNKLGGMHDSISVQNLRSHGFTCTSS